MNKYRKYIFVMLLFVFIGINKVSALTYGGCEYSEISRLKSYVTNVNLTYNYKIVNGVAYFDITLTNIIPEIYFVDDRNNTKYYYNNTNNGEVTLYGFNNTSGKFKFYANLPKCNGVSLGVKYFNLPTYNFYHTNEICKGIEEFKLCKKWANVTQSQSEVKKIIEEYKDSLNKQDNESNIEVEYNRTFINDIIDFYVKYYYILLPGIILILVGAIYVYSKKTKFDL